MATNKAKRSIHLAQLQRHSPNQSSAELMPVKAHVYHDIAEMNAGLEKAIHHLQILQDNHLFRTCGLTAMNQLLRGVRARANRRLMTALSERETANACHFHRLPVEVESR